MSNETAIPLTQDDWGLITEALAFHSEDLAYHLDEGAHDNDVMEKARHEIKCREIDDLARRIEDKLNGTPETLDFEQPTTIEELEDTGNVFTNYYRCDQCGHEWEDVYECQPDDDCGNCGARHISPYKSEDYTDE